MIIDATFWVAISFFVFIGILIYFKIPQKIANNNGNIETGDLVFNKNHKANLMNLCKECHKKVTKEETIFVRKKTMDGYSCVTIQ